MPMSKATSLFHVCHSHLTMNLIPSPWRKIRFLSGSGKVKLCSIAKLTQVGFFSCQKSLKLILESTLVKWRNRFPTQTIRTSRLYLVSSFTLKVMKHFPNLHTLRLFNIILLHFSNSPIPYWNACLLHINPGLSYVAVEWHRRISHQIYHCYLSRGDGWSK